VSMGLNLKDEETVALVSEVAKRLGTTKTAAVRQLAKERLDQLDSAATIERDERLRAMLHWLETEVWPHTAGVKRLTKAEEEELLGYNEYEPSDGVDL
jgi:hypothetical protein